jgi:hypothetical protein
MPEEQFELRPEYRPPTLRFAGFSSAHPSTEIQGLHLEIRPQPLPFSSIKINHTWCDNLIPGIVPACRWGVASGKLVYSSTFGHVPTCVYMSHRPNESFVPEQQRK